MKFGYVVELNATNMSTKSESVWPDLVKRYSTTHFLLD